MSFATVTGIAVFGVLTANVAAFFVEESQDTDPVVERLEEVLRRLEQLERRMAGEEDPVGDDTRTPPEV